MATRVERRRQLATVTPPRVIVFVYHELPDTFEWADDGALSYK